jgi:hypothetical protein
MAIDINCCPNVAMANPIPDALHWHFIGHHQPYALMPHFKEKEKEEA